MLSFGLFALFRGRCRGLRISRIEKLRRVRQEGRTDPANESGYSYSFALWDANGNQIWQIPGDHSNSGGISNSITSIPWGTDPTGSNSLPSVNSLTSGETYQWQIQLQDANGNSTQMQVSYTPN